VNGSSAIALYFGAHIHAFAGDAALAEDYAAQALRLSPFDALAFIGHYAPGLVRIRERRFDDAAAHIAKAVLANQQFSVLYYWHTAALALAGRIEEAKSSARRVLELEPNFHIGPWEPLSPGSWCPNFGARSSTATAWWACRSRRAVATGA
jgi:tetratricopeptide (TPR) repeat protein